MIDLGMSKTIKIFKDHQEAQRNMLEASFKRTPEERILWLLRQIKVMNRMNPVKKKSEGFILPKKDG